jgi:hypothetical protein
MQIFKMSDHASFAFREKNWLSGFCHGNRIMRLSLFGSVLREDFNEESDIDVLVEFEPDHVVGFLRLAELEIALSEKFCRKVDLRTPEELSRYFRSEVVASAVELYAKK